MANFTFKQFCGEISGDSLASLMQIVGTPNVEANNMLVDEGEEEEGNGEEEENDDEKEDKEESD